MYRKIFAAAAAMAILITAPSAADASPILDTVNHNAYMVGDNGYFYPDNGLSRAEAAVILSRLMVDEQGNPAYFDTGSYPFTDVQEGDWHAPYIGFMHLHGYLEGYSDGSFRPDQGLTRAEFTVFISRFTGDGTPSEESFPDVPQDHWAAEAIGKAVAQGYLKGYEDGTFRPEQTVTRAEAAAIINRILNREPDKAYIEKQEISRLFGDLPSAHWAYCDIFEAAAPHTYQHVNGTETWREVWDIPQFNNGFYSETFNFIVPELKTNGTLYPLTLSRVDSIALHHMDHPTAGFRDIEAWHLQRGFDAIGYNFWIDFQGNVYVGRGWNKGAAVANQNGHIISIGFQGDYEKVNTSMPQAQYQAGVELIKWIQRRVPTAKQLGGHGDFAPTDCPGQYFPLQQMIADARR